MVTFLAVGCGSVPSSVAEGGKRDAGAGGKTTAVTIGPSTGTLPGRWTMNAEESNVRFEGDAGSSAIVKRVVGQLMKGESVESRFVADSGEADTRTGRLVLRGHVRVTSERDKVTMTATKVTYDEKLALVIAEGDVTVHFSGGQVSGPYDRLVSTPGLERIGTADRFGL